MVPAAVEPHKSLLHNTLVEGIAHLVIPFLIIYGVQDDYKLLRRCVLLLDQLFHLPSALFMRQAFIFLYDRNLFRQLRILERAAEPIRVVAFFEVKQPGLLIQALGKLDKSVEIPRPQIQLALRSAEVEAAVGLQFPFGVFAFVAVVFAAAGLGQKIRDHAIFVAKPHEGLSAVEITRRRFGTRDANGLCEFLQESLEVRGPQRSRYQSWPAQPATRARDEP